MLGSIRKKSLQVVCGLTVIFSGLWLFNLESFSLPLFSEDPFPIYEKMRHIPEDKRTNFVKNTILEHSKSSLVRSLENYAIDVRYSDTLKYVCSKIEPSIPRVFPQRKMVTIKVIDELPKGYGRGKYDVEKLGEDTPNHGRLVISSFAVNQNYNMYAAYRIILIDSLMLDTIYRASQYKAIKNSYGNPYEQALGAYVASLRHRGASNGYANAKNFSDVSMGLLVQPGQNVFNPFVNFQFSNNIFSDFTNISWNPRSFHSIEIDNEKLANPAHIPLPNNYNYNYMAVRSQTYFERILTAILCHEISHSMLEHSRIRVEKTFSLKSRLDKLMTAGEANAHVRRFLNTNLSEEQEREADIYGARLGKSIGLRAHDFEESFWLLNVIEKADTNNVTVKSHPNYTERRSLVEHVFMDEVNLNDLQRLY